MSHEDSSADSSIGDSNLRSTLPSNNFARMVPSMFELPEGLELLEGFGNWDDWSFRLENVFEAENVWGIVNGTVKKPAGDATSESVMEWIAKDKAAKITIKLAISKTCIPLVLSTTSAAATWKALSDAYKPKGLRTAFYYRSQLLSYRFNDSQPFGPQIYHLQQIRSNQVSAGIPCEDLDFAICLLAALPESYSVFKRSILIGQTDVTKLNLPFIIRLITQEEVERKGINPVVNPEAAFASRAPKSKTKGTSRINQDKTGTCNWCRREGHWEKECRKKKESQSQAQIGAKKSNQRRSEKKNTKSGKGETPSAPDNRGW